EIDHLEIAALSKIAFFVDDVSKTAAHTCREVAAGSAKHDHASARHVFATVVTHTFHNRCRTAVANGKPFTGDSTDKRLTSGRAIESDVSDDDVFFRLECGSSGRINHDPSAGETFA